VYLSAVQRSPFPNPSIVSFLREFLSGTILTRRKLESRETAIKGIDSVSHMVDRAYSRRIIISVTSDNSILCFPLGWNGHWGCAPEVHSTPSNPNQS